MGCFFGSLENSSMFTEKKIVHKIFKGKWCWGWYWSTKAGLWYNPWSPGARLYIQSSAMQKSEAWKQWARVKWKEMVKGPQLGEGKGVKDLCFWFIHFGGWVCCSGTVGSLSVCTQLRHVQVILRRIHLGRSSKSPKSFFTSLHRAACCSSCLIPKQHGLSYFSRTVRILLWICWRSDLLWHEFSIWASG